MFSGSQLKNSAYCHNRHKNLCIFQEKDKTTTNELKKVVVKLNQKNKFKKAFLSEKSNKNLSRQNFDATKETSASPTQIATNNKTLKNCNTRCMQTQQSLSTSYSKNMSEICPAYTKKQYNYEFTEQRFNYERMKRQLYQQQLRSLPLENELRRSVSNSRIPPTCSDYMNHNHRDVKNVEICDKMHAEFIALSKFRMQNSKDCFSNRHHPLTIARAQTPSNHNIKTSAKTLTTTTATNDNNNILLTSMPYALRQRILRDQLAKEFSYRKSKILISDKSSALSYHSKHH